MCTSSRYFCSCLYHPSSLHHHSHPHPSHDTVLRFSSLLPSQPLPKQVTPTTAHHYIFTFHDTLRAFPSIQPRTLHLHTQPALQTPIESNLRFGDWESGFGRRLGRLKSTSEAKLGGHALDAVRRVDVLDHGDLVAGRRSLSGDDGRVCEEELPDL